MVNSFLMIKLYIMKIYSRFALFLFLISASIVNSQQTNATNWSQESIKSSSFIENKGQFDGRNWRSDDKVLFGYDQNPFYIFFTKKGLTYRFDKMIRTPEREKYDPSKPKRTNISELIFADWIGANENVEIISENITADYHSYAIKDPISKEIYNVNNINAFKKITYKNIYDNIDIEYIIHASGGIKYNVILHPNADLSQVKLKYSTAKTSTSKEEFIDFKLNSSGQVEINTSLGTILEHAPITFYKNSNDAIASNYRFVNNELSFDLGEYDHSKTIVIDPWIISPTYTTSTAAWEVETDAIGNVYSIGGETPMQLKKYNSAGVPQWTYTTPWDTSNVWLGTMATDDNGNSYVTSGVTANMQKINNAGALQWSTNLNGVQQLQWNSEWWSITFNCDKTKLIVGGTWANGIFPSGFFPGVYEISMATGAVLSDQIVDNAPAGFTPVEVRAISSSVDGRYIFLTHNDVGAFDQNQILCGTEETIFLNDNQYNLGYKCENYLPATQNGGGLKALIANNNFFYTHTGNQIHRWNLTTGTLINSVPLTGGTSTNAFGLVVQNSGLAVDNCGNVYAGSGDRVVKFNPDLTVNSFATTTFRVYDVSVNSNGEVIACGAQQNNSATNRNGRIESLNLTACAQFSSTCCDATICEPASICLSDAPFTLVTATAGGTFSGPGVNPTTGLFSPSIAGVGTHTITYTLACGNESMTLVVSPCTALVVCVETNGTLTVSNGTPTYTWSNQTTTTTPITNQATCVACGGTATMIGPIYISCSVGTSCTSTVWTAFGTGTNQAVSTYPVQIVDGIGTTLVINSVSGLPACSSVPCPTITLSTSSQTNVACFGNSTGAATVSASGGASAYTYTWVPGNLNGASQSNLAAGTYTINIVDANSCPGSGTVTITQPASALSVSMANTPATCGSNNGTATATPTGGTTSYSYVWSPSGGTGATATNLAAGAYSVLVTDGNGCQVTGNTTVPSNGGPSISVSTSTNVSCFGGTNGSATVSGSGGTGTLSYNWMPGGLTGASQSALSAGTYTVTVTDQGGCSNSTTVTINEPTELTLTAGTINPANCGVTDGSASVIASGGTGTLSYTWSPNVSSSASATNIAAGSYTVTVQDLNLCSENINIVVTSIGGPTVTLASSNDVSCYGGNDGDATINVTGGTAPFTYAWSPSGGSGVSAANLSAGSYSAAVTDDQGCVGSVNVVIGSPTQIIITETITDIICGSSLGQISTSVTGGNGTYSYAWLPNGETTSSISGLAVGTYSLEVTDGSGCSVLENYVISTSGTLTIVATPASTTINAGESVQLNASGATYYTWSPATGLSATDISDPIATPTSSITYTVTGSDANGCVGTALVNIYIPIDCGELFLPSVFSPNGSGPSANNVLCVLGGCIAELNYAVYNRWGEKVFETTDNTNCWDGLYKDKPVNSGVYAYKIYAVLFDGTTIEESGNLTIVR